MYYCCHFFAFLFIKNFVFAITGNIRARGNTIQALFFVFFIKEKNKDLKIVQIRRSRWNYWKLLL